MRSGPFGRHVPWYTAVALLVIVASAPLALQRALSYYFQMSNDPLAWLPDDSPHQQQYQQFLKQFGSDDVVVVSWPGCTIGDAALDQVAERLESPENARFFSDVQTSNDVFQTLTGRPFELSPAEAVRRLRGITIGQDGRAGCVFVTVTETADRRRPAVLGILRGAAAASAGVPGPDVRLVGPLVERAALDKESLRNLGKIGLASCVAGLVLAWLFLGRLPLALLMLITAAYSGTLTVLIAGFTAAKMNPIMLVMPTLVFVLATSSGVHLVNYYRDAVQEGGRKDAARRAVLLGWRPCFYAALTTAFGLCSLTVSRLEPIRTFGAYSSVGVMVGLAFMFLVVPGVLERFGPKTAEPAEPAGPATRSRWATYCSFVVRHHLLLSVLGTLAIGVFLYGILSIRTLVKSKDLFARHTRVIRDYRWFERHLFPMDSIELLVAFDDVSGPSMLEQFELIDSMAERIRRRDTVGGVFSAATFAPPGPSGGSVQRMFHRVALKRLVGRHRQRLADAGYLHVAEDRTTWRISVRVPSLSDVDYQDSASALEGDVRQLLSSSLGNFNSVVSVESTGIFKLGDAVQQQLLHDLFKSFVAAFLVISVAISLMEKSLRAGLVAMIPNLFPAVVVFGGMGLFGQRVDIGAMVTASVALGIAVDDTLHFLTWYFDGQNAGLSRQRSIERAFRMCATAMVHTTLICGLGLLPHAASTCVPIARFAWMMLALLIAALIGDLVFLPALLAGPLGKFASFPPTQRQDDDSV